MRCWVKSRNERNPYCQLRTGKAGNSGGTAGDKPEEGGDDVKSSRPLYPGLHTCYNGRYRAKRAREGEPTAQSRPQYGSESATRLREVGIASNRTSAWCGEYVPGPCTHRPSNHPSWGCPKGGRITGNGVRRRRYAQRGGLSRNKVAVPEGVAGSPPFRKGKGMARSNRMRPVPRRYMMTVSRQVEDLQAKPTYISRRIFSSYPWFSGQN